MKKSIYLLLLGLILFLGSCSKQKELLPNKQRSSVSEERVLTFSLGLPSGEPVTYATQESDEYGIGRLDIFAFKNNKLVSMFPNVETSGASDGISSARKTVAKISFSREFIGDIKFVFVANGANAMVNSLTSLPLKTTSFSDFKMQLTKSLPSENAEILPDLLMTGEKDIHISSESPLNLTTNESDIILLQRVVARLDIGLNLGVGESLDITGIRFEGLPSTTSLFEAANNESPQVSTSVNYRTYNKSSLSSHLDANSTAYYKTRYKKLYYFYERNSSQYSSTATPVIYINADYKSSSTSPAVHMKYKIPFDRSIVRNNLYSVILGVNPNDKNIEGTAKVYVLPWDYDEDFYRINYEIKEITLEANSALSTVFDFDKAKHKLTLSSGRAQTITDAFTFSTAFKDDDNVLEVSKSVDAEHNPNPNNDWITVTSSEGKLTVSVKANTEGSTRSGKIWLKRAHDKYYYELLIEQPSESSPVVVESVKKVLEYVGEYNINKSGDGFVSSQSNDVSGI